MVRAAAAAGDYRKAAEELDGLADELSRAAGQGDVSFSRYQAIDAAIRQLGEDLRAEQAAASPTSPAPSPGNEPAGVKSETAAEESPPVPAPAAPTPAPIAPAPGPEDNNAGSGTTENPGVTPRKGRSNGSTGNGNAPATGNGQDNGNNNNGNGHGHGKGTNQGKN
ncbi:hypothetical protein [Arthrobacter sp. USHLN218]|uniref:hypothetical protein n=1 Tax=Arthrobacter sp. USHLN218 TaxID=3081232 RepID=UPI003017C52C